MRSTIQQLRGIVLQQNPAGPTDGELLSRFVEQRDEDAFAALVRRHGSMVWGACRRVLTNHQDAEDAFQATFLVLAQGRSRRAKSYGGELLVRRRSSGGTPRRQDSRPKEGAGKAGILHARTRPVTDNDPWPDLQPILDQELSRLPDKYRAVVVLCDLEGKGRKEAARQLGCPEGTVAGRLARARAMLAKRLTRRSVTLSSTALAVVLSQKAASGCVPGRQ